MSQSQPADYYLLDGRPRWAMTELERSEEVRQAHRVAFAEAEAQTAAWRTHEAAVEASLGEKLSGGPPSSLGIEGERPPGLQKLVVTLAWIERMRGEVPGLEGRVAGILRAIAVPEETRAELVAEDAAAKCKRMACTVLR